MLNNIHSTDEVILLAPEAEDGTAGCAVVPNHSNVLLSGSLVEIAATRADNLATYIRVCGCV